MKRRTTDVKVRLALALMEDPFGRHWGYVVGKQAGLRSGIVYPALARFLEDDLLTDGWEDPETGGRQTRPRRRYYELTDRGRQELGAIAANAEVEHRWAPSLNPGPA